MSGDFSVIDGSSQRVIATRTLGVNVLSIVWFRSPTPSIGEIKA
jgi:hypothetical protein